MLLDDKDLDVVTVRAEMSRLRRVIGAEYVASRPYRLLAPITSDIGDVFDALDAGDVDVRAGPVPGRAAAAVGVAGDRAAAHRAVARALRGAVLAGGRAFRICCGAGSNCPKGRDDRDGWRVLHDSTADAGPVARAQARGHLAGLDFELGLSRRRACNARATVLQRCCNLLQ